MRTPDDVKARVSSAYNRAADFYDHSANSFWGRFGRRTIERLGVGRGTRVLDLCCGTGASALPAAMAVGATGRVVAVDLAEELVRLGQAKASRLGLSSIDFRVADILALDLENAAFDYVVCVFGIFFVPDMAAALRQMRLFARPGGCIAVTTWGNGLFEPVNSAFWEAIRRVRPELFKSFNPWDQLGESDLVRKLFAEAGLANVEVVKESGAHPIPRDEDVRALLMGTGYRGTLEQLTVTERTRVQDEVVASTRSSRTATVRADVIYATWMKDMVPETSA